MRIMIIGNDPGEIGGVANYTRPLASELARQGHQVFYLWSGAFAMDYDWRIGPYLRVDRFSFPFEGAEIVNSEVGAYNYLEPERDITCDSSERLIARYMDRVKPDVMHVHSRLGLPASVFGLAARRGVKVFNTVHVYGMLCPRRVMIDRWGANCDGPYDLGKCARCVGGIDLRLGRKRLVARVGVLGSMSLKVWSILKRMGDREERGPRTEEVGASELRSAQRSLEDRLAYMVGAANNEITANICVSSDVKKTLQRYGVRENKLLVQHIGSEVASRQVIGGKSAHNPLIIGNIGGAGYYKGTQVLVEAVQRLDRAKVLVKVYGKYDDSFVADLRRHAVRVPVEFLGRYEPSDLPGILGQIDVMILPSICNDTAPQTIFESFSAAIPIIASDKGGFPDFITEGLNGYLFRQGDASDLADKIELILEHPEIVKSMSEYVPRLKTMPENAKELIELYQKQGENICG